MTDWSHELALYCGHDIVCGCDEAGRGPLAGPVYAAAVILPRGLVIEGLDDSKKLSEKKREAVAVRIREAAVSFSVAFADVEEIERLNILNAALLAMRRAAAALSPRPTLALVDGNIVRGFEIEARPVIGGDALCPSIAAASVLAKVSRDAFCAEMDALYPQYGFALHKGYATKAHREAILRYGPCPIHRKSFLKKLSGKAP